MHFYVRTAIASQNSIHTHGVSRGNDFNRPGGRNLLLIYMIYPVMNTFYGGIQGHLDRVCYLT